jgi:hypothetical protein
MNKRWIINILDRSGSMEEVKFQLISEYNNFLKSFKNSTDSIRWTCILFNDTIDTIVDDLIENIDDLKVENYIPSSITALRDAIGFACNKILQNSVIYIDIIVNIFTDGKDNSSCVYTWSALSELIKTIKLNYNTSINFYCTTHDSLCDISILDFDKKYSNNDIGACMKQMSTNSQSTHCGTILSESSKKRKFE